MVLRQTVKYGVFSKTDKRTKLLKLKIRGTNKTKLGRRKGRTCLVLYIAVDKTCPTSMSKIFFKTIYFYNKELIK